MKRKMLTSAILAAAVSASSMMASAATFNAATWNGANSANDKFLRDFAQQVAERSGGSMEFEVFPGGALLPAKGTLEGIQSGVAQIANITASYIPAKMPVDFVTADLSFVASDQLALAFAKTEMGFFNDQLRAENEKLDIVFGTGFTIGIYNIICGSEINSIGDLKGKKIRTSSDAQVEFVDSIGGVAVSAPANEIYTGIQRGTLDCTAGSPLFLTDFFKLSEVAKSVYMLPLGSNANGGYYFNQSFWQARSPEERRILLDAAADGTARSMVAWAGNVAKAWETAKAANIKLVEPEAEALAQLDAFKAKFKQNVATAGMEKRGIADPTPLINEFEASIEKWKGLLSNVDTSDADAVAALVRKEIFDKVDVNTYMVK